MTSGKCKTKQFFLSYSEGNQCEKEGLPLKEKDKQGLEEAQGTVRLE